MVVVFMTFALSGPIAPQEMGVILAVAVLLDATLIRLLLQPVVLRLLGGAPGGCRVARPAGAAAGLQPDRALPSGW